MIIIRADGGSHIGMGHLARTSTLASELAKKEEVCYIINNRYREGKKFIEDQGFKVFFSENPLQQIEELQPDCIITDHYGIDKQYIQTIRKKCNLVGYIDDNNLFDYNADFIINQNFGAEQINYQCSEECHLLLGTRYLLVREEFKAVRPINIKKEVKKVLITIGGSDNYNFTDKIVGELRGVLAEFHVVIGPVFPFANEVIKKYAQYKNVIFHIMPRMSTLMQTCDMAISSCGSTLYELGIAGIPTIGVVVADNQEELSKRMNDKKMIKCIGDINEINSRELESAVIKLMANMEERKGLQKINQEMLNINGSKEVADFILSKLKSR